MVHSSTCTQHILSFFMNFGGPSHWIRLCVALGEDSGDIMIFIFQNKSYQYSTGSTASSTVKEKDFHDNWLKHLNHHNILMHTNCNPYILEITYYIVKLIVASRFIKREGHTLLCLPPSHLNELALSTLGTSHILRNPFPPPLPIKTG